uniref:Lactamase, beta-like 1a n=1 Tax=Salmo trutta TaxID=8032 RepID=A0A674AYB4_SALTR
MLYKLWKEGKVAFLDDSGEVFPLYIPLTPELSFDIHLTIAFDSQICVSISGLPRHLRATHLLWGGDTEVAIDLLQDDALVADPNITNVSSCSLTCHYNNVAFSLLANVLAKKFSYSDYQRWVSDNILEQLRMEETGFAITSGHSKPDGGGRVEQRPIDVLHSGQHGQTGHGDSGGLQPVPPLTGHPEDPAVRSVLRRKGYFPNYTGTPWEVNEQLGYEVVRKDGEQGGYAATFSLVLRLKVGLVVLIAGVRLPAADRELVIQAYSHLISAMESTFRDAQPQGGLDGVLVIQQFGSQVDTTVPAKYRTIRLDFLQERVFRVVFDGEYHGKLKVNGMSVSLESQDRQLFNFYNFNKKGVSSGFDHPGLNTYKILRIAHRQSSTVKH